MTTVTRTAGTALALTPPAPPAARPLGPGYGRAYGRVVISGYQGGRTVPLAGALVRAYVPGTATPWPDPLYPDEAATLPAGFPVEADASGAVALWSDDPARVELGCTAPGYVEQRLVLDLEFAPDDPDLTTDVVITTDASLSAVEAPQETFALAVRLSADAGNQLLLLSDGLYVPPPPERATLHYRHAASTSMTDPGPGYARSNGVGAAVTALAFDVLTAGDTDATPLLRVLRDGDSLYVQDQDDASHWARFVVDGAPADRAGWFEVPVAYVSGSGTSPGNNERIDVTFTMAPPVATAPPVDVQITGDAGVGVTESPDNTFALATRVSPDAQNGLTLRGNGLYATAGLDQTTADARYLRLATGGIVNGGVTVGGALAANGAAAFAERPTVVGVAQPRISVQAGAPSSPATGDLWIW